MLHLENTFKLPFLFVVRVHAGGEKHGRSRSSILAPLGARTLHRGPLLGVGLWV